MARVNSLVPLFLVTAFLFQLVLVIHFSLRKWAFPLAMRFGWIVYALSVPAALVSLILVRGGYPWWMWTGGFLYLVWAAYGTVVEYLGKPAWREWRSPFHWPIAGPYLTLYLATVMFYWWPLARVSKPMFYVQAVLFVITTVLNITSH